MNGKAAAQTQRGVMQVGGREHAVLEHPGKGLRVGLDSHQLGVGEPPQRPEVEPEVAPALQDAPCRIPVGRSEDTGVAPHPFSQAGLDRAVAFDVGVTERAGPCGELGGGLLRL